MSRPANPSPLATSLRRRVARAWIQLIAGIMGIVACGITWDAMPQYELTAAKKLALVVGLGGFASVMMISGGLRTIRAARQLLAHEDDT